MPVCVINHIGLSFLRRLQAFTVEKEKKSENRFVIQLQEQHKPKGKRHHRMAMAESEWEKKFFLSFPFPISRPFIFVCESNQFYLNSYFLPSS